MEETLRIRPSLQKSMYLAQRGLRSRLGSMSEATSWVRTLPSQTNSLSRVVFLLSRGTFKNIDVDLPGAFPGSTNAIAINPNGDIVGFYYDSSFNLHSFLLSKGRFITIDVPAAFGSGTQANGINQEGDIVGTYSDSSGNLHGFLLSK
jgi:hypothetical protein